MESVARDKAPAIPVALATSVPPLMAEVPTTAAAPNPTDPACIARPSAPFMASPAILKLEALPFELVPPILIEIKLADRSPTFSTTSNVINIRPPSDIKSTIQTIKLLSLM